ncbi:hypothetical protein ACFVVL_12375 [Kitasatospora sp. NPDC058115]|uniref:hypothetical protein n=1 Tax=Kitasatospora sp. NPDC058115 TaxID=3346347 RepID=UPI0036D919F8
MATVTKDDPTCSAEIIFTGNIGLRPFIENPDTLLPPPHATAVLNIDVLAATGFENTLFEDIEVVLEIKGPPGVRFVEYSERPNWHWGNPDGAGGWVEVLRGTPTTRLRMRLDEGKLLRPAPVDGLTFYTGLSAFPVDGTLDLAAVATARRVTETAQTCSIEVTGLKEGETLRGRRS